MTAAPEASRTRTRRSRSGSVPEVAELIQGASRPARTPSRGSPRPVASAGPLFDLDDLVAAPVQAAVTSRHPRVELCRPVGDALDGVYRLAAHDAGRHHELVLRIPAAGRDARPGHGRVAAAAPPSTPPEET